MNLEGGKCSITPLPFAQKDSVSFWALQVNLGIDLSSPSLLEIKMFLGHAAI